MKILKVKLKSVHVWVKLFEVLHSSWLRKYLIKVGKLQLTLICNYLLQLLNRWLQIFLFLGSSFRRWNVNLNFNVWLVVLILLAVVGRTFRKKDWLDLLLATLFPFTRILGLNFEIYRSSLHAKILLIFVSNCVGNNFHINNSSWYFTWFPFSSCKSSLISVFRLRKLVSSLRLVIRLL